MCFSPAASFAVSGTLFVASAAIAQRKIPKIERSIAIVPFLFAAQQFLEGIVWLYLYTPGPLRTLGVYGFSSIAFLVWPIYAPLAMLRVEKDFTRRKLIKVALAAGIIASLYALIQFPIQGVDVALNQQCLQYQLAIPWEIGLLYWIGANGSLILSSNTWWVVSGILGTLGVLVANSLYPFAVASIWCYFAAITSLIIALYFFRKQTRK